MKVNEEEKENIQSQNKVRDSNIISKKESCHLIENEPSTSFDLIQLNSTNYNLFMKNWEKHQTFKIPDCFKLIKISDYSGKQMTSEYQQFTFSILSYTTKQLCHASCLMLKAHGFYSICDSKLTERLVQEICFAYKPISYHNFSHAFSLMHMLYQSFKIQPAFKKMFTDEEIGYSLIAGLAHDLGHPGTNNMFEVKLKSQLAIDANNEAVLEKMHVKQFFTLLKEKNLKIFDKSSNASKIKQMIIQIILSTDVSKHFTNLEKMLKFFEESKKQGDYSKNKNFYLGQVFHACDIGNPCLAFQDYLNWSCLLSYQFNTQTALEQQYGVEVTEMLKFKSLNGFYKGQIGFIGNFVLPLWSQLSTTWPGLHLLVDNIRNNLSILKDKQKESTEKND